ncbi:hypothetical protein BH11ARM1_BH11ARM1_16000 [soil metagenome]
MTANRKLRWIASVMTTSMLLVGCGRKQAPDYPTWSQPVASYSPSPGSSNAFDAYVIAAQYAEEVGGANLDRVNYFPGHKKAVALSLDASLAQVEAATAKPSTFNFVAHKPFEKQPNLAGWRLLGLLFQWKIDDACKAGDFDQAIRLLVSGSKFGFDLTGGDAIQASLGLSIVDQLRRSIAPFLDQMTAAQLDTLASGMTAALARRSLAEKTIQNESKNMLAGVQYVQDEFEANRLDELEKSLGSSAKDGVTYLRQLQDKSDSRRIDYFKSFAAEADAMAKWASVASNQPVRKREKPKLEDERPWRRIGRHFFGTLEPLLAIEDESLARTRLLILNAMFIAKAKKQLGPSMAGLNPALITDPYSGRPFVLHSDGLEFSVYSIGSDLKDDGGDTDVSCSRPDLLLEHSPTS